MSPSKESMRPRNTEAEKAEKWIEKMNGQVLSSIDVEDERLDIQNKGKVEFTCESPHGWTEDFSQAVWGPPENKDKRFAELNHAQKNLVLNAWMMLAHQGISLQNQTGVEWEVDFDQNPPSYKMKDRKGAREGSFVQPEYQEEIGHTREAIDELHQTDVARNVESAPGAVDPTVLDDSTEKGSIMHVLDAVGHGDLATRQARVNYFKSGQPHLSEPVSADEDPLLAEERAGVNKYLVEMLGQEKAEKYLIDIETGEGYRATAVQNRAWVQYIRYDRYEILDTPEQKEKHAEQVAGLLATIEQAGKAVQAIVPDFLDGDFAEYLTANVFVESFYEEGGEWKFTLGYDFKNKRTGKSIFEDGPRFVDGDYIGDDLENNIPRIVGEDIFEKEQESMTAAIGEEQAHQKSLEPSFKEDGERLRAGETERKQVQEMVESYLATKHRVPRGTIEVRWGKVGKFGSRKRFLEVTWKDAPEGLEDITQASDERFVRTTIPMKALSTWRGQWDEMFEAFEAEFQKVMEVGPQEELTLPGDDLREPGPDDMVDVESPLEREDRQYVTQALNRGENALADGNLEEASNQLSKADSRLDDLEGIVLTQRETTKELRTRRDALAEAIDAAEWEKSNA